MNLLFDRLFAGNKESGIFLSFPEKNEPLTYQKFLNETKCIASRLKTLGLEKGDRLVLQIEKSHHVFTIYGACLQLGVIFIPINTSYTAVEVEYFLKDSECQIFIATAKMKKDLESQNKTVNCKIETIDADYMGSFFSDFDENEPLDIIENQEENDIAAILYTSGTTGRSKGAMLSQKNLLSNALTLSKSWGFTASDVLLHALHVTIHVLHVSRFRLTCNDFSVMFCKLCCHLVICFSSAHRVDWTSRLSGILILSRFCHGYSPRVHTRTRGKFNLQTRSIFKPAQSSNSIQVQTRMFLIFFSLCWTVLKCSFDILIFKSEPIGILKSLHRK